MEHHQIHCRPPNCILPGAYHPTSVSIQVPTADGSPPASRPPVRPSKWLVLVLLVAGAVALAVLLRDETPPTDEPTSQELVAVQGPSRTLDEWELTRFPGAGRFVDVASGSQGAVAAAHGTAGPLWMTSSTTPDGVDRSTPVPRSTIWAFDPDSAAWRWMELEEGTRSAVSSVALDGETVLAAGTVHEDEVLTAALWSGPIEGSLAIVDRPFAEAGALDIVRVLDGRIVLVGRLTEEIGRGTSPIPPGTSRVLTGTPGDWTDITPPGDDVVISEIISTGEEWIAVGGREGEPAVWHSLDRGVEWDERRPVVEGTAFVTDVTMLGSDVFAMLRLTDPITTRTQLIRHMGSSWTPAGEPRTQDVRWIAPLGAELIGGSGPGPAGPRDSYLWQYLTGGRWSVVEMAGDDSPHLGLPTLFTAATDEFLVGTVAGQPALWHPPGDSSQTVIAPQPSEEDRLWERVAVLPGENPMPFVSNDVMIVMDWPTVVTDPSEAPTPQVYTSVDGARWDSLELPANVSFATLEAIDAGMALVGHTPSGVVAGILKDAGFETLGEFEGRLERFDADDDSLILFVRLDGAITRFEVPLDPNAEITETPLSWNATQLQVLDNGAIIGFESDNFQWPPEGLRVSTDGGKTWTAVDVEPWAVFSVGTEAVLLTGPSSPATYRLTFDPVELEPVTLPPELGIDTSHEVAPFGWAGGLATHDAAGRIHWLDRLGGVPVTLDLSPITGFQGVFMFPSDGRHVAALENGEWVLYRWTGRTP